MHLEILAPMVASPGGAAFAVVFGLLWGSFANVCIYRWPPTDAHPRGRSVVAPPSHCFACGTPIRWYDNVPLLAYLWLRGRCRACGAGFSPRYLIVEAATGALFGLAWWHAFGDGATAATLPAQSLTFAVVAAFSFVMVVVTFIDLDHRLILDRVTYPAVPLFLAANLALPGGPWWEGLAGAALGFGSLWAIGEVYFRATGREAMGLGDAKLLAVIGALLGWRGVVAALAIGSVLGSIIGVTAIALARRRAPADPEAPALRHVELPFGPFLAAGALAFLHAGPWLVAQLSHLRFR